MLNRLVAASAAMSILFTAGLALGQTGNQPKQEPKAPETAPKEKAAVKKDEPKKEKAGPTLKVGDKAPAIQVGKFVKGEPITSFEKGQIYVVEFWATWCGPCIDAIPHITELQKQYKDKNVRMLGVSVWESDQTEVEPFVKKMGDKMVYTVAMDEVPAGKGAEEGKMAQTWMAAAGRGSIPSSFVVGKDSTIVWIGHPTSLDEVLPDVVAGTFDPKVLAEREKKKAEAGRKAGELMRKMNTAIEDEEWADALKAADELDALKEKRLASPVAFARYRILLGKNDATGASAVGNSLFDSNKDSAAMLNQIAWYIVDPAGSVKNKDLALAMKTAERANELTKGDDAAILDTLARVHFEKGNLDKAIELQTKAVEKAPKAQKDDLQAALDQYKAKKGK